MQNLADRLEAVERRSRQLETAMEELRVQNEELRTFKDTAERRFRTWRRAGGFLVALCAAALGIALAPARPATAQTPQATLEERVAVLEQKLLYVSRVGRDMVFNAVNVHIRNGGTQTNSVNSLGNLIVGFNERRGDGSDNRTGSHNLIVGSRHNYRSFGGLVVGNSNEINAPYASVSGGYQNTASGVSSSVSGGNSNTASSAYSSVSGGRSNTASEWYASVSGGYQNTASGASSSVSGGDSNIASGSTSSVSGGRSNTAGGWRASVSGGENRTATGDLDWRAGELFQNN